MSASLAIVVVGHFLCIHMVLMHERLLEVTLRYARISVSSDVLVVLLIQCTVATRADLALPYLVKKLAACMDFEVISRFAE